MAGGGADAGGGSGDSAGRAGFVRGLGVGIFGTAFAGGSGGAVGSGGLPGEEYEGQLLMKEVSFVRCRFLVASCAGIQHVLYPGRDRCPEIPGCSRRDARWGSPCRVQRASPRTQHALDALSFACELTKQSALAMQPVACAVATSTCFTGLLGTMSQKSLHCFGPTDSLSRLCETCSVMLSGSRCWVGAARRYSFTAA